MYNAIKSIKYFKIMHFIDKKTDIFDEMHVFHRF